MDKNEAFGMLCEQITDTHKRKSHDYGDSFGQMWERFGITSAVIRLSDKMNRVYTLTSGKSAEVKDESLRDTLLDLASYAIMTVVEMDKEKGN